MTFKEFIDTHNLTLRYDPVGSNPHMHDDRRADHWRCLIRRPGATKRAFTTYFSKGYGHHGAPPTLLELLYCLASDARGSEELFETWALELGFDPDSRKAESIWRACRMQSVRLKAFLGEELYAQLLDCEED
jgi:hypothetical protein